MSYSVKNTTITLTRGDTFKAKINIYSNGEAYTPASTDVIRFAMKSNYGARDVLITKTIPHDTLILTLSPNDTKSLSFGSYVYDIQLTKANGDVDTFISGALQLTAEVN